MKYKTQSTLLGIALLMIGVNFCFGHPTLLGSMTGEADYDMFGFAVSASACDFNYAEGNHWGDVVVGAYRANTDIGEAYVYYGASTFNTSIDLTLNGPSGGTIYDWFGFSLSGHMNLNGDVHTDIVVGAPGRNTDKGEAYIFYGGASMNNGIDVTLKGDETYDDFFGFAINNTTCNVDNNTYGDVVIGAPHANGDIGRAYVYYGGNPMNNTVDITLNGESVYNEFGYSISCGYVNDDYYSDIVIGAPGYNSSQGRVYIFYGGNPMNNTPDITLTGETTGDRFGESVCLKGKCLIVGAPHKNSSQGKVYIDSTCDGTWDIQIPGTTTGDEFGTSVYLAQLGDDGYDAFLVGAPGRGNSTGEVYAYRRYTGALYWTLSGAATYHRFGTSIDCGHDVNGNGSDCSIADDIIIGAPSNIALPGKAYVYDGVTFHPPTGDGDGAQSIGNHDASSALEVKPNPFKNRLSIMLTGRKGSDYRLRLFDVSGRIVKTVVGYLNGNTKTFIWDRRDDRGVTVGSGIYPYQYECGNETASGVIVAQ